MAIERSGKTMSIYIQPSELKTAQDAAAAAGVTLNEFVRRAVRRFVKDGESSGETPRKPHAKKSGATKASRKGP